MKEITNKLKSFKFNLNYVIILPLLLLVFVMSILFFITFKPVKINMADQLQTVNTNINKNDKTYFASGLKRWNINKRRKELNKEMMRRKFMNKGVYD